jgi:hypothetical protein
MVVALSNALAGEWARGPIEPKLPTDYSAYTLGRNHGRVGLFDQDYGLWTNVDLGITAPLFVLGVPNLHGKIQAITSDSFDIGLDAGWYGYDLEKKLQVPGGYLSVASLGWRASWVASPPFSIHFGTGWLVASAQGEIGLDQLGSGLESAIGANLGEELANATGASGAALYAGADVTVSQLRLAADYRINRRDSVVVQSNTFLLLTGTLSGGYDSGEEGVEVGATAHIEKPLTDQLQSVLTASWQFSWPHWYLRVGLPVPTKTIPLWWIPQAFEVSWVR